MRTRAGMFVVMMAAVAMFATACGNDYTSDKGGALSAALPMTVCVTDCRECYRTYDCGGGEMCCGAWSPDVLRVGEGEQAWICEDAALLFRVRNPGSRCWVSTIY